MHKCARGTSSGTAILHLRQIKQSVAPPALLLLASLATSVSPPAEETVFASLDAFPAKMGQAVVYTKGSLFCTPRAAYSVHQGQAVVYTKGSASKALLAAQNIAFKPNMG